MAKNTAIKSLMVVLLVLVGLVIVGGGGYWILQESGIGGEDPTSPTSLDCETAPTFSFTAVNQEAQGTAVTVTNYTRVRPAGSSEWTYIGSTLSSAHAGDEIEVLYSASDYIDKIAGKLTVKCGDNRIATTICATDDATIRIKNDDGDFMTDAAAGGATNQTATSAAELVILDVEIAGNDNQCTGDLIYVVELGTNANISSVTMSDSTGKELEKVSVPSFYTQTLTTSPEVAAFRIPGLVNAVKGNYQLAIQLATSSEVSGAVYTTTYSEQAFVDVDGTFKSGVEDADGTNKYEDDNDFDFYWDA